MGRYYSVHALNKVRYRTNGELWRRYQVNRDEVWLLSAIAGVLSKHKAPIIGKAELWRTLCWDSTKYRWFEGYLKGLINKGLLGTFEYVNKPGSLSLGISELGAKVLLDYEAEISKLKVEPDSETKVIPVNDEVLRVYRSWRKTA